MILSTCLTAAMLGSAATPATDDRVDFVTQIQPILEARCIECHGPERQRGDLRLDERAAALAADEGQVIVPGDAAGSELLERISRQADARGRMPGKGEPLAAGQIELLRRWIDEGAVWPEAPRELFARVEEVFEARCLECHGPREQEADLRLDLAESALQTGDYQVIVPGDAEDSILVELISLEADDPEIMPAEGDPLTAEEIDVIRHWVEAGAWWPDVGGAADDERGPSPREIVLRELTPPEQAAVAQALERIRKRGGLALRVAQNTPAIEVDFSLLGATVTGDDLRLLKGLEPALVWLNLSRTKVEDTALAALVPFAELRRLSLARTAVGDGGVRHLSGLAKLESLNLYGTRVTDAGLQHLAGLESLRALYLWQSSATAAGAADLQDALPQLRIDRGEYVRLEVETEAGPVNALCPLTGKAVVAGFTAVHEGVTIGFCCANCLATFEADPTAHVGKVKEFEAAKKALQDQEEVEDGAP